MSRRRSANPTKAISVTLPSSLLDKLEDKLLFTESRSAWIAGAIRMRLEESSDISEVSSKRLLAILHNREDLNGEQKGVIGYWLKTFS